MSFMESEVCLITGTSWALLLIFLLLLFSRTRLSSFSRYAKRVCLLSGLQPILRRPWFSAFGIIGCVLPLLMLWVSPVLAGRTRPVSSSFLPSLNQATQQTTAHPSENDEGRPLARKAPQATPKKQRVKRDQDYLTQLKELDIPESAKAARTRLVATLQDKKSLAAKRLWTESGMSASGRKQGVSQTMLQNVVDAEPSCHQMCPVSSWRKSHIYFSNWPRLIPGEKTGHKHELPDRAYCQREKAAIKRFLDFQDDDLKELAESGSVRAFSALNQQFPENLETFKDFIGLFGEGGEHDSPKACITLHFNARWQRNRRVSPPGTGILGLVTGQGLGG